MSLFVFAILSFCKLNFICNNNLYIRLSFHFTYEFYEEVIGSKIYLPIISDDVILMLLYPHIFKWFCFCCLFVNAFFLMFKTVRLASCICQRQIWLFSWWNGSHQLPYWFTLTFFAFHPCYLLFMGRTRFCKYSSLRC